MPLTLRRFQRRYRAYRNLGMTYRRYGTRTPVSRYLVRRRSYYRLGRYAMGRYRRSSTYSRY